MPEFQAELLSKWTGGRWTAQPEAPIAGFCVDSRQLRAGQVFVAIRTDKRDGHDFLAAAQAAGAAAAIVSAPNATLALPQLVVDDPVAAFQAIAREHRLGFKGRVIGISGSAGKTSTKDLLALLLGGDTSGVTAAGDNLAKPSVDSEASFTHRVLATEGNLNKASFESEASFNGRVLATEGNLNKASFDSEASFTHRVLATEGNLNNHLGVPLTLTRLDPERHDFAVVEAGISSPGEMEPLARMIEPDVSLITLVAPAHTQELGGLEGVAREKSRLSAATRPAGVAVFARETAEYPAFRELGVRSMVLERADVLRPAEPPKDTVFFTLTQREQETAVALAYGLPPPLVFTFRRVSDGMAQNAALAICTALWLGVPPRVIQARLAFWKPAKLRAEIRREDGRLLYLDCYNANPASMADALAAFDAVAPAQEPRLYIIGSMEELGSEAEAYHRALGRSLELRAGDEVFLVGTHAADIRAGAIESGDVARQLHIAPSADALAATVGNWRGAVFVKGSRRYQLERVLASANNGAGAH